MQKLKYLIILALGILLGLVYLQLDDYDNISNSLLDDNIKASNTIKDLQDNIQTLKDKNEKLQENIVFLYNKVDNLNIEIEYLENELEQKENNISDMNTSSDLNSSTDSNTTLDINGTSSKIDENKTSSSSSITLDNENTITGFGNANE